MDTVTAPGEPRARGGTPPQAGAALARMVTGPWNRLAHEAARRFVESRGAWSRVLLVSGGEGNGKTRLLAAIEDGLREGPGRRPAVVRASCEDFLRHFTYAATHGRMAAFRQKYRTTEVLLFDDADRLSGRPATQEEFQHLFDHLDAAGRSVVVTSRVRPRDLSGLRKPLQSRLAAAMQVRLEAPDEPGRRSLLQHEALRDRRTLPADALAAAAAPPGTVRDIVGRWARLREMPVVSVAAASVACAPASDAGPTLESILCGVCSRFGLAPADIRGGGRSRRLTLPRHVCFYLAKKMTAHSLQEIADFFGGRNHATVLYAVRRVADDLPGDAALRKSVESLMASAAGA